MHPDGIRPLRKRVAAIAGFGCLAAIAIDVARAESAARDVVILSRGRVIEGLLVGCSPVHCEIAGESVPRRSIVLIGLGVESLNAASVRDFTRDQIHLIDYTAHPGVVMTINADHVITAEMRYPRSWVDWIYLAPSSSVSARPWEG